VSNMTPRNKKSRSVGTCDYWIWLSQSYSSMIFYCKINITATLKKHNSISRIYRIYSNAKPGFFPLISHFYMLGHLQFVYEVGTMWSQTKACIPKSSCEFCALLRYYMV